MSDDGLSDRIDELFLAAIDLPASARRDFVVRETANDSPEVRDRLFELIEAEDEVGTEFAGRGPLNLQTLSAEDLPDIRLGEQIGDFVLQERIASGGFGTVYRATRETPYKEEVAIKLLHRENLAAPPIVQRVLREMQALSDLRHPYIVSQLQSGVTEQGEPFLVMEFIQGRTLNEHCDVFKLSIEERLKLFQKICEAVSFAHENNWVHRDLKPGNILVQDDGTPKLLDFGIAKLSTPAPLEVQATLTQGILGTPPYMSPEQFSGRPAGPAADIYALGAILYELLSGHRVYDVMCQGIDQVVLDAIQRAVCETTPRKPSTVVTDNISTTGVSSDQVAHLRQLNPATLRRCLAGDIDNIAMMALRKEPDRRYTNVTDLRQDIQRWLEHRPVEARADSWAYRTSKFLRRNRTRIAVTLAFAVSLSIGAAAISIGHNAAANRDLQTSNKHVQAAQVHLDQDEIPQAVAELAAAYRSAPSGPMKASVRRMIAGWSKYLGIPLGDDARLRTSFCDRRDLLVTTGINGTSNVWRPSELKQERQLQTMRNCERQVISPDGKWLMQQSDNVIRVTNLESSLSASMTFADEPQLLSAKFARTDTGAIQLNVLSQRDAQAQLELSNWLPALTDTSDTSALASLERVAKARIDQELNAAEFFGRDCVLLRYSDRFEIRDAMDLSLQYESGAVDSLNATVADQNLIAQGFRRDGDHKTLVWDSDTQEAQTTDGRLVDIDAESCRLLLREDRKWKVWSLTEGRPADAGPELISLNRDPLTVRSSACLVADGRGVLDADFQLAPSRHILTSRYERTAVTQQRFFHVLPDASTILRGRDQQRINPDYETIRFGPAGNYAIASSLNPTIDTQMKPWLWNCQPYLIRSTAIAHPDTPIRGVAGGTQYTAVYSNDVLVGFDSRDGQQHKRRMSISSLAVDEASGLVVAGDVTGKLHLLQLPTLDEAHSPITVATEPIRRLSFDAAGERLLVLTPNALRVFNFNQLRRQGPTVVSNQLFAVDTEFASNLMNARFNGDGQIIAWTGKQVLCLQTERSPSSPRRAATKMSEVSAMTISSAFEDAVAVGGEFILGRVHEGRVYVARSTPSDPISDLGMPLPCRKTAVRLAIGPHGNIMAVSYKDGTTQFWDTRLRAPLSRPHSGLSEAANQMVFSQDARRLTVAAANGTVAWFRCDFEFVTDDRLLQDQLAVRTGYEWNESSEQIQRMTANRWATLFARSKQERK